MPSLDQAAVPHPGDAIFPRGMWTTAWIVTAVFILSNSATPLYVRWQTEIGFSSAVLTAIFGAYIVGLLPTLLVAGQLSDRYGRRPVLLPGLGAAHTIHRRIQEGYAALKVAVSDTERSNIIDKLLSTLGTYRYHLGASTPEGRLTADRMHALKQRRSRMTIVAVTPQTQSPVQLAALGSSGALP